jgi:hypothetical protein
MVGRPFTLRPHKATDKRLVIEGPVESLILDFDDVDRPEVLRYARRVIDVLNAGWRTDTETTS